MTTKPNIYWSKAEAADDLTRLLKNADKQGPQTIVDGDRIFEVRIVRNAAAPRKDVLVEPGPLTEEDFQIAFGPDKEDKSD